MTFDELADQVRTQLTEAGVPCHVVIDRNLKNEGIYIDVVVGPVMGETRHWVIRPFKFGSPEVDMIDASIVNEGPNDVPFYERPDALFFDAQTLAYWMAVCSR